MTDKKSKANAGAEEKAGKVWVSRTVSRRNKDGSTTILEDTGAENMLEVKQFRADPAYVRVGLGVTINLGNFESARCDVGLTLPCYVEEIQDAYVTAWNLAEIEIQKQTAEVKGGRK